MKPGAREQFIELLRRHWPTLRDAGLATDTPAPHFEAEVGGGRHNGTGTTFVEIFSWTSGQSADLAHRMPEVMAVWEPMGALVEVRDGHPGMEFPNFRHLDLDQT